MLAAVYRDGYIISHAGVHPMLNKKITDPEEMVAWVNSEMEQYLKENQNEETSPYIRGVTKKSPIFNIGGIRGGWHQFGGIFWLDWNYEKLDKKFNQIVGHTHAKLGIAVPNRNRKIPATKHVKVDCDEFTCYNTYNHCFEDFMPVEMQAERHLLEVAF